MPTSKIVGTFQVIGVKYIKRQNTPLDLTTLNDGYINDVIGVSEDRKTLYTYHKTSKRSHEIRIYELTADGQQLKLVETRKLPKLNVRSTSGEYYLSPDREILLLAAELRPTVGRDDIYSMQYNKEEKTWSKPINLGEQINSKQREFGMYVKGDTLFYTSDRTGNLEIYYSIQKGETWSSSQPYDMSRVTADQEKVNYYRPYGDVWVVTSPLGTDKLSMMIAYSNASEPTVKEEMKAETPVSKPQQASSEKATPVETVQMPTREIIFTTYYDRDQYFKAKEEVTELIEMLRSKPGSQLEIIGYADAIGTDEVNERVKRLRAEHIANLIKLAGLEGITFEIKLAPATTSTSQAYRKVEVFVVK